jgi:hypothetical protein
MTEVKLDETGAHLEASPKKSRRLDLQCGVSKLAAHIGTKLLKLKSYRTTVVHQLLPPDAEARINYCRWFQQSVYDGMVDPDLVFYTSVSSKWLCEQPEQLLLECRKSTFHS